MSDEGVYRDLDHIPRLCIYIYLLVQYHTPHLQQQILNIHH